MKECKQCEHPKADLVHPENWGEHQFEMERLNPGILKSAIPNAHKFEPLGDCADCDGTGVYLLPDEAEQTCVPCGGTGGDSVGPLAGKDGR